MDPQLPIEVDERTGVWSTDGLPMLYVPRHFFINNHAAIEAALGRRKYAEILYPAGYRSAYFWCEKEATTHGLARMETFAHYLKRLSQRGWGLFEFINADPDEGRARIALTNSAFVLQQPQASGKLCYMFAGWFAGAMDWVTIKSSKNGGIHSGCEETQCASEGAPHCIFTVTHLAG